uniref:HNH nuclease domain-containing protein n=1 Tax=Mycena chlorophos TaxID=658473 RepID=A0ABQ0M3N2_MYCCL|nr:predicted protein [Mycena chlorophos]
MGALARTGRDLGRDLAEISSGRRRKRRAIVLCGGWHLSRGAVTLDATASFRLAVMSYNPGFVLNKRVASQGRNMHLFSLTDYPCATIAGGLNLTRFDLNAKTFYRWLHLCNDALNHPLLGLNPRVVIRPITLKMLDVMFYQVASVDGPVIPRDSEALLNPGIYGVFSADGSPYQGSMSMISVHSISFEEAEARSRIQGLIDTAFQNEIPSHLASLALARDQGRCVITGRTDQETQLVWIVPPAAAMSFHGDDPSYLAKHRVLDNIITLSSNLVDSFGRNAFTVDIDDNARVLAFSDLPSDAPQLLKRLSGVFGTPSEDYWRFNFLYTLTVYFPTGRADFDHDRDDPNAWMEELVEDNADLEDPKWSTQLGKEVLDTFRARSALWENSSENMHAEWVDDEEDSSSDSA